MSNIQQSISSFLAQDNVKKRFQEILGKKAQGYISSVLQVTKNNHLLASADPKTIIGAAVTAATLDLPIDPNLGFSYIIPYKDKAQFQIGYKGFIQLAQRSGQYEKINVAEIYKGELLSFDRVTEEIQIDYDKKESDEIVGYVGYFKLLNGFEKRIYLTVDEIDKHGKRFSQTYKKNFGIWKDDFDSMARKTVIKKMLSKWGILSIQMQEAVIKDQAVIRDENDFSYDDNENQIDFEDVEIIENKTSEEKLEDQKKLKLE